MNKYILLKSFVIMLLLCSIAFSQSNINIIPVPQVVNPGTDRFVLDDNLSIILKGNDAAKNNFAGEQIQNTLKNFCNINADIFTYVSNSRNVKASQIVLEMTDSLSIADKRYPEFNGEGYYLNIEPKQIIIRAFKPCGIFYGSVSLMQLLEKASDKSLPCMNIVDWSDMKMRGISDDISRGQVSTLDNFKKIIRNLARYKMNIYLPYLEDMLQLSSYPSIGKGRGALSKDEVKELVAYAGEYFIEVIPVFQTLGHYENILSQDEYVGYAEFPGAASLNVSSDSTYIFLENMLKEVFEMFPSPYFHIGADESYDVGLGKSKEIVEKYNKEARKGKADKTTAKGTDSKTDEGIAAVHANHYNRVYNICRKYNKKVMMYSDIVLKYPKIIELIPKDIIMIDWHYGPSDDYTSTKKFRDAGFKFLVSPTVWNFYATFPVNALALPNIKQITESGIENNSIGMINSNWGDYGAETFREFNYFGYAWSAQCSWNIKGADLAIFSKLYFYDFFGMDDLRNTLIYQYLSIPYNQVSWHEFWRHPLLPFRDAPAWEGKRNIVIKSSWLDWTLPVISAEIQGLKEKSLKNNDHYDLIDYIIRLDNYYKYKIETQLILLKKLDKTDVDLNMLTGMIDKNISLLSRLRDEYNSIWLRYYKESNLNMVIDKFNRLIAYFAETKEALKNNSLQSPLIKSDWIYMKTGKNEFAAKAVFHKEFMLEAMPDSAFLQLMGDTYARLLINGQYVDRVYARSSLSLSVDYRRIKLIDIKKYLKDSLNIIEVQCENYNENDKAGFNIYSEIYIKDRIKALLSDESWAAKLPETDTWAKATSQKFPKSVIAPEFKSKRTSWIER